MKQETEQTIMAAKIRGAELDAAASALFKNKEIVAPILQLLVDEFKDMSIEEIIRSFSSEITEEPIDDIDVKIEALDPEMKALFEKWVFFDNRFDMRNPKLSDGKIVIKLHFDLEVQNQAYESELSYPLVKRGIYNMARVVSKQLGPVTKETNYSKLEKTYGIWICNHNIPLADRNTITRFRIIKEDVLGHSTEKEADYDLMTLLMVKLGTKPEEEGVLDYLDATFKGDIEKMQKYSNVEWSAKAEKEAKGMTGLADVYFERGVSQGLEQGLQQGRLSERIRMLLRFNVPEEDIINEITKEFGLKEEEVKELIKMNHKNS